MKLTILGSGTAAPLLERNNSGYMLEADGKKFLLDSGAGITRRLLELKFNLFDIGHIFYTHLHNDHINDLGAIIWGNNYGGKRKKALNLYGPKGFKKYFRILNNKLLQKPKSPFGINIKELKNSKIKIGNVNVTTNQIKHSSTTKSIAYRFEHKGKSCVYASDSEYCSETIKAAENADVLLIECSFPNKVEGHLTPSLAGKIASKANVKVLILTHFYPEVLKTDIVKQCRKTFDGKIVLASDKMKVNV
ncbi:MBL fold metallo-hydrolase [Candidatus Woesearchaeota archaeon]|jgi:ribonuclease BN (tRNA processing enzyme)|nr:MBL fold metallo-hydrolase [Candidatus Woesearchaeota archaeon]|tara:strand:+ start:17297 stop:18040 length:744 start_codon:yes stop_codon:yes gene_type:complete